MIRYALLGLVQGVTEFLPVSSSGHLVLAERLLGLDPPGVLLESMLHWGTLAAVFLVFRHDVWALLKSLRGIGRIEQRKDVGFLLAGTVPIVVVGLLFRSAIESAFTSLLSVGIGLLITAAVLMTGHWLRRRLRHKAFGFPQAVGIGLAQAASVFPGISRSGLTLSAGMASGLSPEEAVRFSFLLAMPALAGAGLLHLTEALRSPVPQDWMGIGAGTLVAFISGWGALKVVIRLIHRRRFWLFSVYCGVVGIAALIGSKV